MRVSRCSAAWTGANCSLLNLLPATAGEGLGSRSSSWSFWGNKAIKDPVSGKYFMAADEMANHCGLGSFGSNSRSIMAQSDNATGPYTRVQVVVDSFSHGTWMERDPSSGRWILGHMGSGAAIHRSCKSCATGVTPPGAKGAPCPQESAVPAAAQAGALVADSPLGPWRSAGPHLINGANCEPFFMRNGTLFFVCPWGGTVKDSHCNNQNAGLTLHRAETLDAALAGNYTELTQNGPTYLLGGTNQSKPCQNWEGNNFWLDEHGYFHSLAHAYRGQPCDYPVPGCKNPGMPNASDGISPCTATGGHSYSLDGQTWFISPVAPFTSTIEFVDGSKLTFRARERAHLIFDDDGLPLYLGNGMGNPGAGENTGVPGADHTFVPPPHSRYGVDTFRSFFVDLLHGDHLCGAGTAAAVCTSCCAPALMYGPVILYWDSHTNCDV